jgi:D-serine deaminase-like pyridoxal phosphate-dependent protein
MTLPAASSALLSGVRIDATTKGFPDLSGPVPLEEVPRIGWTGEDLAPPNLVLRHSAMQHNVALMARFSAERGVGLAPHGKLSMAPQLWWMQLDAGAWGIAAAGAGQARVMRAAGVPRVLIANELADAASLEWVAAEHAFGNAEIVCQVDSDRSLQLLDEAVRASGAGRPLPVLVELGHAGGRTGCRDLPSARALAARIAGSGALRLAGATGYEGTLAKDRSAPSLDRVRAFLDDLRALADALVREHAFEEPPILSAGGSMFFDLAAERLSRERSDDAVRVLIRPGGTLTHDHGMYEAASPFASRPPQRRLRPAIEVWGTVLSTPEPGRAILGLGRRDVPFDQGFPVPLAVRGRDRSLRPVDGSAEISALDDQHAYCRFDADVPIGVGDVVRCGISHPCTALDKWRVIPVLDDEDRVVDAVATFF